jgi:hypothetical protein
MLIDESHVLGALQCQLIQLVTMIGEITLSLLIDLTWRD